MEKKLNIAAILQEKPSGIKLWSDTFGYVFLLDTHSDYFEIKDTINNLSWRYSSDGSLTNYKGTLSIYPSRNMRDWSKFAWKKGDVLRCGVDNLCIFESWANNNYTEFYAMYVTNSYANSTCPTKIWSKETNEEIIKQYISNIEEIKGGNLNLNTLTIEKVENLPKKCEFKPMDWCLMRDHIDRWKLCQFGFFCNEDDFDSTPYNAVGGTWYNECIPYNDQTAHLLGTTDDWEGGNNE